MKPNRSSLDELRQAKTRQNGLKIAGHFVALAAWAACVAGTRPALAEDKVQQGRELFAHEWTENDPLSPDGDGLGPMYNAKSCVACHSQGGMGGAGAAEHNVSLLAVVTENTDSTPRERTAIRARAAKTYPTFGVDCNAPASLVLHQFSSEPRYERWRLGIVESKGSPLEERSRKPVTGYVALQNLVTRSFIVDSMPNNGYLMRLIQRNTPALFGARLVDSIPDETLLKLAKDQAERYPGIEGRVGRTRGGKVGKFGWRGQSATLQDFVLTACAVELGLQNADHPQAANPLLRRPTKSGNDLTKDQCDALIAYVASLPAPREVVPSVESEAGWRKHGEKLFESSGCTACHVRDLGEVEGIYSDLLLHDMGPGLDDPVPAFLERSERSSHSASGDSPVYGSPGDFFVDVPPRLRREWKTPPLWGVRDSAPYLHDGRARTLADAIAAHGGEAELSMRKYKALDYVERSHLLVFLNSLAAPEQELLASDTR